MFFYLFNCLLVLASVENSSMKSKVHNHESYEADSEMPTYGDLKSGDFTLHLKYTTEN